MHLLPGIICDVSSVFGSESVECFPDMVAKFCFKPLVTVPVAPVVTGMIVHFMHNIRCISVQKDLYFNFFSAYFALHSCQLALSQLSVYCYYYYY
jgi:hypothetical protein